MVREHVGRLKAPLRCAPALRGLDPPHALPGPCNCRSADLKASAENLIVRVRAPFKGRLKVPLPQHDILALEKKTVRGPEVLKFTEVGHDPKERRDRT
jgi:hypothetical protein